MENFNGFLKLAVIQINRKESEPTKELEADLEKLLIDYQCNLKGEIISARINRLKFEEVLSVVKEEVNRSNALSIQKTLEENEKVLREVVVTNDRSSQENVEKEGRIKFLQQELEELYKLKVSKDLLYDEVLINYRKLKEITKGLLFELDELKKSRKNLTKQLLNKQELLIEQEKINLEYKEFRKQLVQNFQSLKNNCQIIQYQLTQTINHYKARENETKRLTAKRKSLKKKCSLVVYKVSRFAFMICFSTRSSLD